MNKLEREWWEFHQKNPAIFQLFTRYTKQAVESGRDHYSAKAIIERIRWHTMVETTGSEFKICNNHTAYYARHFVRCHPEHEGFFRMKNITKVKVKDYE